MESAWRKIGKKTGSKIAALALTVVFSMGLCRDARAAAGEGSSRPVVFSYAWDVSERSTWLLGAFRDGGWTAHTGQPILAGGRAIDPEEALEMPEPVACVTPLLKRGEELAFYSAEGKKIGIASVRETWYSVSAASMESFIDVETDGPEMPARVPIVGVGDGWNATPVPTVRAGNDDRITFTAGSGDGKMLAAFLPAVDEYGEMLYRGAVTFGGKTWPLTGADVETPDELEGFFIDLNGDGRMEFLVCCRGTAGFVAVFELGDAGVTEVLVLDLSD
jgi:hypothetical protein